MMRWVVLLLLGLWFAVPARADTGGSMGGGGGGRSSYSSGSSYRSRSSHSSDGGYTEGDGKLMLTVFGPTFGLMGIWWVWDRRRNRHFAAMAPRTMDVGVVRVAVDARARPFVQAELQRIASVANTATFDGRGAMVRQVALLLRHVRDAWVYGGAINEPLSSKAQAKVLYDRHVASARSRYRQETIRNANGVITTQAFSPVAAPPQHGHGLVLVTIVLLTTSELPTITSISHGEELRAALETLSQQGSYQMLDVQVIWQPSEDHDRLSSIQLEEKYPYPELVRLNGALVGKVFCGYCGAPFPAELVSCPFCNGHVSTETPRSAA